MTRAPQIVHGDCLEIMKMLPDNSVDSIVTDPPYGLGFMGKAWDALPPGQDWAEECLRVLKPGGHLLAFGGTRTWHRLAVAVEDAGFEIRDSIAWMFGSGFPKHRAALKPAFEPIVFARKPFKGSLTANEAVHGTGALSIDGCRIGETVETWPKSRSYPFGGDGSTYGSSGAATEATQQAPSGRWPANVALDEHMAAVLDGQSGNVGSHGLHRGSGVDAGNVKAIPAFGSSKNRDAGFGDSGGASRFFYVAREEESCHTGQPSSIANTAGTSSPQPSLSVASAHDDAVTSAHPGIRKLTDSPSTSATPSGSRPNEASNTQATQPIESVSSQEPPPESITPHRSRASSAANQSPTVTMTTTTSPSTSVGYAGSITSSTTQASKELGDTGSSSLDDSRFMYVAKAPKKERPVVDGVAHATVKPLALMRWLVRLVTPEGGTVLEPFAGSGTTVEACILEGFHCIAIEREAEYLPLIQARIDRQDAA